MPNNALRQFLARHGAPLKRLCRIGFALCIGTVTVLSLLPGAEMPKIELSDKVSHFIAYTAIGASGLMGWPTAATRIAITGIGLGGALEIGQLFVPGRSAEMLDFIVDIAGIAAGLLLARLLLPLWSDRGAPVTDPASRG